MAFIKNGDPQPIVEIIKKEKLTQEQKEVVENLGKDKPKKTKSN